MKNYKGLTNKEILRQLEWSDSCEFSYGYSKWAFDEIERLNNIIDKAIDFITSHESIEIMQQTEHSENNKGFDEKAIIEMTRRYLTIHNKLLEILKDSDSNE